MSNKKEKKFCDLCEKEKQKSVIIQLGYSETELHILPFYDQNGDYHFHDVNIKEANYECSRGHQWKQKESGSCWCGWDNNKTISKLESIRNFLGIK